MSPAKTLGAVFVLLALVGAARLDANSIGANTPTGGNGQMSDTAVDLSGMVFGSTVNSGGSSNLVTINPNDGSLLTSVGIMTMAGALQVSNLTVDSNNFLYGTGANDGSLYRIDKVTGMASLQTNGSGVPDTGSFFMFPGALALLLVMRGLSKKVAA